MVVDTTILEVKMDITERKITKIARDASRYTLKKMKAEGVGSGEFDFIHMVRHNPGITQAQIREELHIDKGAAARRTASLEAKGYLVRKNNPDDKRSQCLFATEKAEELKNSKAALEANFYEWLTDGIDEKEAAGFLKVLNKLYNKAKAERLSGFCHIRDRAAEEK
jgi:DNA-binding MarR family transcriptional regulator